MQMFSLHPLLASFFRFPKLEHFTKPKLHALRTDDTTKLLVKIETSIAGASNCDTWSDWCDTGRGVCESTGGEWGRDMDHRLLEISCVQFGRVYFRTLGFGRFCAHA
jgi:hypothetical protein